MKKGLSCELVNKISKSQGEPEWMRKKRLEALKIFESMPMPGWGVDLGGLDFEKIEYFIDPGVKTKRRWQDVPGEIKRVYDRLGIVKAEKKILAGVGAQWDSGVVYQSLKKSLDKKGVVFCSMQQALKRHEKLVKKYFMTECVGIDDNKFAALHAAVWSGGSFVHVPKGVKVRVPVQGFFWMNARQGGQFEHTLIIVEEGGEINFIEGCSAPVYASSSLHVGAVEIFVGKRAKARYATVQNWSLDVYNLATKRAIIEEEGVVEWISGSMGSGKTMVYPTSILKGKKAKADHLSLSMAGKGQELDTGGKVIHLAKDTSSNMVSKSICKNGGITTYRGLLKMAKGVKGSKANVTCDALMLDDKSQANTYPAMEVKENEVVALHEAKTGKIAEEKLFYLMSRGLSEREALVMIVEGFLEPVIKKLPLEYAVEMNRLIELEMEGSVG